MHLGRLVLERVEAVQVAGEDLHRRDQRRHPHRHREHLARVRHWPGRCSRCQAPTAADREGGGQIGGDHGVDEAVGKARVEDDRQPAVGRAGTGRWRRSRSRSGVCIQLLTDRIQKAEMNVPSATMQVATKCSPLPDLVHAEQHHAEEAGLEEEGGQHLIGHQRADDRPGLVGEHRPVGAELVGHDDARDDAHGEDDGEDLQPVAEQVEIDAPCRSSATAPRAPRDSSPARSRRPGR